MPVTASLDSTLRIRIPVPGLLRPLCVIALSLITVRIVFPHDGQIGKGSPLNPGAIAFV